MVRCALCLWEHQISSISPSLEFRVRIACSGIWSNRAETPTIPAPYNNSACVHFCDSVISFCDLASLRWKFTEIFSNCPPELSVFSMKSRLIPGVYIRGENFENFQKNSCADVSNRKTENREAVVPGMPNAQLPGQEGTGFTSPIA